MVGFIIGVVGFGILIVLGVRAQLRRDKADGVIARFADLRLSRTHLHVGSAKYPLVGVTARVESEGEIRRRVTATRVLATGVLALAFKKKIDERSVFLTVEGPGGVAVVREIAVAKDKNAPTAARSFAASVNFRRHVLWGRTAARAGRRDALAAWRAGPAADGPVEDVRARRTERSRVPASESRAARAR